MKGKKINSKQEATIVALKIENPDLSLRDIQNNTWINKNAVNRVVSKLPETLGTTRDKGQSIIDKLSNIVEKVTNITNNYLEQVEEDKIESKDLKIFNEISKINFDRLQLLTWKPTEIVQFDLNDKSLRELEDIRNSLLN